MRQFGLLQHIPDPVDTDDHLHGSSRRGRADENWCEVYADSIEIWNQREDFIAQEQISIPAADEYMEWYLSITRRYISPRPLRLPSRRLDYEPHANKVNRLVCIIINNYIITYIVNISYHYTDIIFIEIHRLIHVSAWLGAQLLQYAMP